MDRNERLMKLRARALELVRSLEDPAGSKDLDRAERLLDTLSAQHTAETKRWLAAAEPEFWARFTHELRTPLATMMGFVDLLLESKGGADESRRHVITCRRNGHQLLSLIDAVEALSKLETGSATLELGECWLGELLDQLLGLLGARAAEKGIDFSIQYTTPVPATVRTDAQYLRRILSNLIDNAIKFTDSGGVRVQVGYKPDAHRPTLTFAVIDTGIGIDAAALGRIFEPFRHADAHLGRRYGGTGLGLALSAALANGLGGELTFHSSAGEGSTFELRIPVIVEQTAAMLDRPSFSAASVLLAVHDREQRHKLMGSLRRAGHAVILADNGRLAVDSATKALRAGRPFDVIVLGLLLPELDGCDAAALLRADGYQGVLVGFSSPPAPADKARCLAAGCDAHIGSSSAALVDILRELLETPPPTISVPAPSG